MITKFIRTLLSNNPALQEAEREAKQKAKDIILRANEEALRIKQEAEREGRHITNEALDIEKRIARKESQVEEKEGNIQRMQRQLEQEKAKIQQTRKATEETRDAMLQKLEKVAQLTKDQAQQLLLNGLEDKLKAQVAQRIRVAEEQIKEASEEKARQILVDTMKFGATDYVAEYTLSVVQLPDDSYKGRIIGKDGRNIRAFELATGVDVDLEEEGVIKISSFDAIRREIARVSLERLIKDGRIQPQRIEEIVHKTKTDIDKTILKAGEDLAHKFGLYDIPRELLYLLGKFKYRYSYGQNMITHTIEETQMGIAIAHQLKADAHTVKLGCLFHDIGKVIEDKEGNHIEIGVKVLQKYKFAKPVIDCVESHHEDVPFPSVEAVIVYIADAISGSRPGARHEDLQEYFKRIKTIEDTAKEQKGVRDAYALQAGRELRVVVSPQDTTDDDAVVLAQKIRDELEKKFEVFPGQITVTVLREFRTDARTKI